MPIGAQAFGESLGGFLGKDKVKQIRYSEPLQDLQTTELIGGIRDLSEAGKRASANYETALTAAKPQSAALNQDTISRLTDWISRYGSNDTLANYERLRSGNLGALANEFVNLATYGEGADKQALLRRGYGGRGPSSYENILRSDRISRNIAPVLGTIYGNLGTDAASIERSRLANLAASMGLLEQRQQLPLSQAGLELLPYQAQVSMLAPQVALAGDVGQQYRENVAGYQVTPNKWKNFFQKQGQATDQLADFALDAVATYYGMGGMTGGGGAPPASGAAPASAMPSMNYLDYGMSFAPSAPAQAYGQYYGLGVGNAPFGLGAAPAYPAYNPGGLPSMTYTGGLTY